MTKKQRLDHYRYEKEVNAFFLKHAAKLLKRHPRTVKRWIRDKKVAGEKSPTSGYWYVSLSEINRLRGEMGLSGLTSEQAIGTLEKYYPQE